jgi:CRISPR-associated protein Cmr6
MNIPLRRQALERLPYDDSRHPNIGLMLRRGLAQWPDDGQGGKSDKAGNAKADLIGRIAQVDPDPGYAWAYRRWCAATADDGFKAIEDLTLIGRLYIGLTRDNPLETGITVGHAWGMPMIPGSALKGISRHIARAQKLPEDAIVHLFGAATEDDSPETGAVVFHDAWWTPTGKPFVAEVVTPHHTGYYNLGSAYATDFDSPIPAAQIAAQGRFRFVVEGDAAWCRLAIALLRRALMHHGVGGKTTSGYGLFAPLMP